MVLFLERIDTEERTLELTNERLGGIPESLPAMLSYSKQ